MSEQWTWYQPMSVQKARSRPSIMKKRYGVIPSANISRSTFDRSHSYKSTFNAAELIPFYVDEALPGDTFTLRVNALARFATPLKPLMDNLYMDTHFFAVPYRLVWQNWEKFNGEQVNPGDTTDYTIPAFGNTANAFPEGSLGDYMGLPTGVRIHSQQISALPFRAYNLIWNEWFRDQNLQSQVPVLVTDAGDAASGYTILKRGKRHDYFTSCLPWPQKGDAVSLPLGTQAPVKGIGANNTTWADPPQTIYESDGTVTTYGTAKWINHTAGANSQWQVQKSPDGDYPNIYADLTNATAATINQLRQAFQIQKLLERDARGGTRYPELIKAHFNVDSADQRLQRPEYLGGGSSPIMINPVAQTSETLDPGSNTPQGNLAAIGTGQVSGHGFTKSFTEHCILIGLVSVRADLTYQQGVNRMWLRKTRWEFFWPALQNIGEQAVTQSEIYQEGDAVNDAIVFGYQERFAEYRSKPSLITGKFRSQAAQPLDFWHLGQKFDTPPVLDNTFITENPPIDRVIAVPSEPHFLFDAYISLKCARPMPLFGVPGMIDHF